MSICSTSCEFVQYIPQICLIKEDVVFMGRLCDVGLRTCSEMFEIGMNYRFHMTLASCDIEPGSGIVLDGND